MLVASFMFGLHVCRTNAQTILASDYPGMKIALMKDGFIRKLNIMVTALRSVHRDAEKYIKVSRYC